MLPFKDFEVVGHKNFRQTYDSLPSQNEIKMRIREIRDEMLKDINKGDFVKKKPYPDRYLKLGVKNLYVHNLPGAHRRIYTIRTDEEKKTYQYLDLLTHKEYDILFGYSTS
jgi:hypothetical protein